MHLTLQADYALRTLVHVGTHTGVWVPVPAIAEAYGISVHHVTKVAKRLAALGYVRTRRGQAGGIMLAQEPESIRLGDLIRQFEPDFTVLECFDPGTSTCPLTGACELESVLHEALDAFLAVIDRYTLKDLLRNPAQIAALVPLRLAGEPPVKPVRTAPHGEGRPRRSRVAAR